MTSDDVDSAGDEQILPFDEAALRASDEGAVLSERRLFQLMFVAIAVAVVWSLIFAAWRTTTGLALGGALSLLNHHWLRTFIAGVFNRAATAGARPHISVPLYVLRYFIGGGIIAAAVMFDSVSIVAVLVGLCSFAAALVLEGLIQIYVALLHRKET